MSATVTRSAAETEALGAQFAELLEPGDVVVLSGEVGAGKTTLIRGACRALGVEGPVTSPTFTIGQRYEGASLPISHLDLYRLEGLDDEDPAHCWSHAGHQSERRANPVASAQVNFELLLVRRSTHRGADVG